MTEPTRNPVPAVTNDPAYDPLPLARAILRDYGASPLLVIAAWRCLYLDQPDDLVGLAFAAVDDVRGVAA